MFGKFGSQTTKSLVILNIGHCLACPLLMLSIVNSNCQNKAIANIVHYVTIILYQFKISIYIFYMKTNRTRL